ncbi:MAG: hypothetical protein FJX42_08055 [Alphaproteobacteria bacterium]|nr:hypothetical protein [Alphaproteobacteria bacterium]
MNALLAQLSEAGLSLVADGDRLRVAPANRLTADLRQAIRSHKPELLAALRQDAQGAKVLKVLNPERLSAFKDSAGLRAGVEHLETILKNETGVPEVDLDAARAAGWTPEAARALLAAIGSSATVEDWTPGYAVAKAANGALVRAFVRERPGLSPLVALVADTPEGWERNPEPTTWPGRPPRAA